MKPGPKPIPLAERFWRKVYKTKTCWLWIPCRTLRYGTIWVQELGRQETAHRVSWFLATGEWPTKQVLHKCDNTRCVRHSHHFQGTQADNLADMVAKGREPNSQKHKTQCPQGHPYAGNNLSFRRQPNGKVWRRCKACAREYARRHQK